MLSEELKNDLKKVQEMREKRQLERSRAHTEELELVDKIIGFLGGALLFVMIIITFFYWFQ
jgi:hypothetical protein